MRKSTILAAFMLLAAFINAQSLTYSFDMIRKDSFYLVETYVSKPTPENPRGTTTTSPTLFRDSVSVRLYLSQVAAESEKYKKEAEKFTNAANILDFKSNMILKLITSPTFVFEPKQ